MTWSRCVRIALTVGVVVFLTVQAGEALRAAVWTQALALYALAFVFAYLLWHDWQTAADYADAVDAGEPTEPTTPAHARLLARRVLAGTCRCERWWTSLGTDHDPACPTRTGDPRANRPHRRPSPRHRPAAAPRRRRRHRPR